jgi:hypothetical protein
LISLFTIQVLDGFVRENFKRLQDFVNSEPILRGNFQFMEITLAAAGTRLVVQHKLGFQPKDVITLAVSNEADVTWHYDDFTSTSLTITTTAATTIRAYVGRHKEGN